MGNAVIPVFNTLETLAANMELVHADDSHVKITHLIHQKRINPMNEGTGMFTTGILARSGEYDIALFYNGTRHAGENLEKLLAKRDPDKTPVIHMCDALSRNIPATFKTILCNCLSHDVRKFDDLKSFYPAPYLHIIKEIAKVYEHDEKTRDMTHEERLRWHQQHSKPVMEELYQYIHYQLELRQVEPNDSLGKAMRYMLKHWHELTQFLRVADAPLDNNILEHALKIPIRGRRTWLFYKTEYGAYIGGVITSVIYTCALACVNPLSYLTALLEHKSQVVKEPKCWLPWNFQDKLAGVYAMAAWFCCTGRQSPGKAALCGLSCARRTSSSLARSTTVFVTSFGHQASFPWENRFWHNQNPLASYTSSLTEVRARLVKAKTVPLAGWKVTHAHRKPTYLRN